jgi:hypothetical protein
MLFEHGTDIAQKIKGSSANVLDFVFRLCEYKKLYNRIGLYICGETFQGKIVQVDTPMNDNTCKIAVGSWPFLKI